MFKLSIPYKAHNNKYVWDYLLNYSIQLNNINLADNLDEPEAEINNIIFMLIDKHSVNLLVSLSNQVDKDKYQSFCNAWSTLHDCEFESDIDEIKIFSFDIKKYNNVLSFTEEYQNRDKINVYINENKLYYCISDTNAVDVSPIIITSNLKDKILSSYNKYKNVNESNIQLTVNSVDKNSFLLPFMGYRDFLNFTTYSANNKSSIINIGENNYFLNLLEDSEKVLFYSKCLLRNDKFILENNNFNISSGLWQILVILQHYKIWQNLYVYKNSAKITFNNDESCYVNHIFESELDSNIILEPDLQNYKLVGEIHSNELYRLNKLFSNANRTCFFDFSNQTFTGNNYVFNDDKLEKKTVDLSNKIKSELPLQISMTELKHFIGSDLSQKNFNLRIYTDGIRVMFERWNNDFTAMECRIIFDHSMSKRNQKLV